MISDKQQNHYVWPLANVKQPVFVLTINASASTTCNKSWLITTLYATTRINWKYIEYVNNAEPTQDKHHAGIANNSKSASSR